MIFLYAAAFVLIAGLLVHAVADMAGTHLTDPLLRLVDKLKGRI